MECRRCKQDKADSEFSWKIKALGTKQTVCKSCVVDRNKHYRSISGTQYDETKRLKYQQNIEKHRAARSKNYQANREIILARGREWQRNNPEKAKESAACSRKKRRGKQLEYNDSYREANREQINAKARETCQRKMRDDPIFKEKERLRSLARNRKEKELVLSAYGGSKCACCGETQILFLTIDHLANNGSNERKDIGIRGGCAFYRFLRKANYPSGYQVLCFNCNAGKHMNGGICPHNK